MYEMGKLYTTTCGPDLELAFTWFRIAARFGLAESQAEADKLAPQLSDSKRSKAEAAVAAWITHHSSSRKEADND